MKIGFDLDSLNISISAHDAGSVESVKKLFATLSASGHELFVFYCADMNEKTPSAASIAF